MSELDFYKSNCKLKAIINAKTWAKDYKEMEKFADALIEALKEEIIKYMNGNPRYVIEEVLRIIDLAYQSLKGEK
jgi:hypothetical protein